MDINAILLKIVLPCCIGALVIFSGILTWILRHYRKDRLLKPINEQLNADRFRKLEADISKIDALAQNNPRYKPLFDDIRLTYDELENEVSLARNMLASFENDLKKLSYKSAKIRLRDVQVKVDSINSLEAKLANRSGQVIDQDELLRAEFAVYKEGLREAVHLFQAKRLLLDKLVIPIEKVLSDVRAQEVFLEGLLTHGKTTEAFKELKVYGQLIVRFCNILNEAPNLQTYVYEQIPRSVEKLTLLFKENYQYLSDCMPMSHFESLLYAIKPHFGAAKDSLNELSFDRTRALIKEVLKTLKMIERQISFELQSRQILVEKSREAFAEVRRTLHVYEVLQQQISKLVSRGMTIPLEIKDLVDEASTLAKQTNTKEESFKAALKSKEMLYSARVSRGKMLLEVALQLLNKVDEISQVLWTFNAEATTARRQYKQAEAAVSEVISNAKRQNLIMTPLDQERYVELTKQFNLLAPKVRNDVIGTDTKSELRTLVSSATAFYKTLGTSAVIAEMASNLIRHYAPVRALEEKINHTLAQAENLYVSGRYAEALNLVIRRLEERTRRA